MRSRELLRIVSVNDVYELKRIPALASLLSTLKSDKHMTLSTINGDFLSPSVLSGLDKGRGMIDVVRKPRPFALAMHVHCLSKRGWQLNSLPITHCCFGNHEADVGLKELAQRVKEFRGTWLNSNMRSLKIPQLKPYDVVTTPGGWRVGLLGFLLDDKNVFSDGTFKGHKVEPVLDTARELVEHLRTVERVDTVISLTHQSLAADVKLAEAKLGIPLILGGHDHEVYHKEPDYEQKKSIS